MIKHELFPTLVTEFHNPEHNAFKEVFFERFHLHCNEHGQSNENTANNDLHQDKEFNPLFQFVFKSLREHLKTVALDPDFQQLYLVKSWLMITRKWHVPVHNHADAHISFVYYVNIPTDIPIDKLCLLSPKPNEYYSRIYGNNAVEWNNYNCNNYTFVPKEGMLLFFPGSLEHFTGNGTEDSYRDIPDHHSLHGIKNMRICLAGDLLFTYKTVAGKSFGLMPISNWIKAN
jgi:hypothetical protein